MNYKYTFFFALILFFISINPSISQDSLTIYELGEDIVVTASRIPTQFPTTARSIVVIDREQIRESGANSVGQLLETCAGIDLQQRGYYSVQADLNIRGATFEQSLVLIDGVKMIDPQTGHHTMDIPLTVNDIQKIEILKGQGSRLYGPNAFGGVINIITKKADLTEANVSFRRGENQLFEGDLSVMLPAGNSGHRISVSQKKSDGYRMNTDFNLVTAAYGFNNNFANHHFSITSGYTDKKFGANSFYHPSFPNQWERTQTSTVIMGLKGSLLAMNYTGNIFWRYHTDEFMLNRDDPSFYHNRHFTHVYGVDFQISKYSLFGNTALGIEAINEQIESNNLGSHKRNKTGIFIEHQASIKNINLTIGSTLYRYSDWGWQAWPGVDVGYRITENSNLYASAGYAFRAPTYTELYYSDPANRGNSKLRAEKGWNYELGYRYLNSDLNTNIALFRREGNNLIDWIWQNEDSLWQVMNISRINTNGFEFNLIYLNIFKTDNFGFKSINMKYTFLNSEKDFTGNISKYVLTHLQHQAVFAVNLYLFAPSLKFSVQHRYEDRMHYGERFLLDTNLSWQIKNYFIFHLDVSNIFNHIYEDFQSVPLPGRWIKTGISLKINSKN